MIFVLPLVSKSLHLPTGVAGAWIGTSEFADAAGFAAAHTYGDFAGQPGITGNPDDAVKMGINGKNRVRVTSRRGSIEAQAWVTDRVPPGVVYANFHFPEASANELTQAVLDPVAKIPEYKVTAVKVELV